MNKILINVVEGNINAHIVSAQIRYYYSHDLNCGRLAGFDQRRAYMHFPARYANSEYWNIVQQGVQ